MSAQKMEYAGGVIQVDENISLNPVAVDIEVQAIPR